MRKRVRTLVIALVLGGLASAIGIAMLLVPADTVPMFHRVTDLVAHVSALDYAPQLGLRVPAYESIPNPDLGIIQIDDATLKGGTLGPWPFPRSTYARLLHKLKAAGAKVVVFDIDFLEPRPDDAIFATAMRTAPTVLGYVISETTGSQIGEENTGSVLSPAAAQLGYTTIDTPGGYLIGQPMQILTGSSGQHRNERLLALSAAGAEVATGNRIDLTQIPTLDGQMLLLPPDLQSTQEQGTLTEHFQVPFAGRALISFADVMKETPEELRPFADGATIYVGATAQGLFDFVTTARGRVPGLFVNARLTDQLMRGYFLRAAPLPVDVLLIFLLPLIVSFSFTLMRPSFAIALSLAATLVYAYANVAIFITQNVWFDLVHVVLAMVLATLFVAAYRVLQEGAARRMVTGLFGMHVSPAVVDHILEEDDPNAGLALRGKRVKATIFYSDIRGFTAMSETMTPEEIYAQLNEYFEEMCAIIFHYGGYVDKFIGDCVMAVFSAPFQTPDDASKAVRAAVAQQKKIAELAAKWRAQGKREFTVGMGINTGDVVMGNLGSSSRMNYTVIGDNVNVAARLYNVALGGEIIISETTYAECRDFVQADEREAVAVKGKKEPLRIYNVVDVDEAPADI